jgi:hypothetical protein
MAQAAVDMGGGDGKPNLSKRTPSSFSLRVGRACVLVTILDKDPLVINTGGALSILRTPELLCSLVGRLSDCLTVRSMVNEMDENSISECGSHISAAGLALQLADDNQLRSLYTNARPLVYNSLILGRDKNTNTYLGYKGYPNSQKSRRDKDDTNNSVMNSMTGDNNTSKMNDMNDDDKNGDTYDMNMNTNNGNSTFNNTASASNNSTSITNNSTNTSNDSTERSENSASSSDNSNNDDNNKEISNNDDDKNKEISSNDDNKEISADRDNIQHSPLHFSRIFKVDLSGTMLRVQAGAIGNIYIFKYLYIYVYINKFTYAYIYICRYIYINILIYTCIYMYQAGATGK